MTTTLQIAYRGKNSRVYAQCREGDNFVTYALRGVVEFLPSGLTRNLLTPDQALKLVKKINAAGSINLEHWTPIAVNGERIDLFRL
tara:strand:+ start:156 stop:413 length:258 start_codon:yes stop_codon:yes gene_type:complete